MKKYVETRTHTQKKTNCTAKSPAELVSHHASQSVSIEEAAEGLKFGDSEKDWQRAVALINSNTDDYRVELK